MDNEELLCIVLRGLPKEFAHFCSAIRTRSDPITYEQLSIMLQSEEQAMAKNSEIFSHSLAMFASNNKTSGHPQSHTQGGFNRGRGRNNSNRGRGGGRNGQQYHNQFHQNFSPQYHNQSHQNQNFQNFSPRVYSNQTSSSSSSVGGQTYKGDRPTC